MKTTKEDYFTIIPNKLFYSASANEYSIFKLVNDAKVVLVFDYFYTNMNRHKEIKFTIEDMVSSCGYIPNANAGRINSQFKKIIVTLYKNKLIKFKCKDKFIEFEQDNNIDFNIEKIRYTQLYTCTLNIDLSLKFIQLYEKEKSIILDFKDTDQKMKIDNTKLLLYYCYIKSRVYKRNKDDDIQISGGRAEVAYPSFNTIYKDLHFTDKTIKKYNDLLVKLDMIRYDNAGLWYYKNDKNKIVRESVNFYTLFYGNEDIAKKNLNEGIKYYKSLAINSNKVFTNNRKYINNNRAMNGEYGSIIKKELHGIATPEDIKRKLEIIENKNPDDTTYKIKALIDSSPDGTLSQIYMNLGKEDLSAKYEDLELKFGLVDVDGNLLVDRDYYSWVITNYQKFSEQHIINSVAAYVRKHKISYSPFNNNGKSIDLSTDNKVPEVEKQAYMYKQLNYTSIDNDINNIWGKSKSNPFHSENQVSNF